MLLAIELLLDAGDFNAANELYKVRLEETFIFLTRIPAPIEGIACVRSAS